MMGTKKETGLNILDALASMNLTIAELARLSGISETSIYGYIHGLYYPSMERLVTMSQILGVSPFDLLASRKGVTNVFRAKNKNKDLQINQ